VYRVTNGTRPVGTVQLLAKERKFISGEDSLILSASVVSAEPGNGAFTLGDSIVARVDPETLSPFEMTGKMTGQVGGLGRQIKFDQKTGAVSFGQDHVDAPIGTHTILSFLYAIRSFNLNPSRDVRNPVNDTRVAVFWNSNPNIFMLRPFEPETITVNGQKLQAQKVTIKTNDSQLDQLGVTVWLSTDPSRTPLMVKIGLYQAELISASRSTDK
jgi:hypothetical protein